MIRAGAIALALLASGTSVAQSACRQALALGVDVSGSVDAGEYRLQMDGIAAALTDPAVSATILAQPGAPVALAVYEWSGTDFQRIIVDWTLVDGPERLQAIAARMLATERVPARYSTSLGSALTFGAALIARSPDCWQATLDISGDGKNNDGPDPRSLRERGLTGTHTVNALVIGTDQTNGQYIFDAEVGEMVSYFRAKVIQGDGAFVETALGFENYAEAMKRKLLRELTGMVVAGAR